jgi:serine protease inhibitor
MQTPSPSETSDEAPADAGVDGATRSDVDSASPTKPLDDGGPTLVKGAIPQSPLASLPSADLKAAVAQNNAFGIALYQQLAPLVSGGNFLTSTVSASLALTMAYAGAESTTATQMASALQIPQDAGSIFDDQNALSQTLSGRGSAAYAEAKLAASEAGQPPPSPADYELQVINSVWGQSGNQWQAPFLDILSGSYGTGVYTEDFEDDPTGAESDINDWVSSQTSGVINPLLPPSALGTDTQMVLVNAVHLAMPWANPFDATWTTSGSFTRGDGSAVTAPLMYGTAVGYADTSSATYVSLPLYGGGISAVFALPKGTTTSSLVSSLTASSWASAWSALGTPPANTIVHVVLPKFTFTTSTFSLKAALMTLGMPAAFDSGDFNGIAPGPLSIRDVLQKATISVLETGVQAAAATAVTLASDAGLGAPPTIITVTFDQPFLLSIVDGSGAIVFLGQVNDPTDTGSP